MSERNQRVPMQGFEPDQPIPMVSEVSKPFVCLKTRMHTGHATEIIEVANIPATPEGVLLMRQLVEKWPNSFFYTTDFGMLRIGDVDIKSLSALNETAPG